MPPISRRKFFFFGLAAGIGLMLPDSKIELTNQELVDFTKIEHIKGYPINGSLMGISYHYNDGTTGIWLEFDRGGK